MLSDVHSVASPTVPPTKPPELGSARWKKLAPRSVTLDAPVVAPLVVTTLLAGFTAGPKVNAPPSVPVIVPADTAAIPPVATVAGCLP
jgi:hypothetical protein